MSDLTITTSPNIAVLSSLILADLCAGKFYVDIADSTFIGNGAMNVMGASVKIVNPYGVAIKQYPSSGFDISGDSPPMFTVVEIAIPTQAGTYQYGTYLVSTRLTDADGTEYEVTKPAKVCAPDPENKSRNYGSLSASISGICKEGKAYIVVDTPPNYNGATVESTVNDFDLLYPTESQLPPIDTTLGSFSVPLYEGEYRLTGTVCATYNHGDKVYTSVFYKVKKYKQISCQVDECCVYAKLAELHKGLNSKCTVEELAALTNTVIDALRLMTTAKLAAQCGEDASDYIADLELLLGCKCTCNCNAGAPIIDTTPARDIRITGCNVAKESDGTTDSYTIDNFIYKVEMQPNENLMSISAGLVDGCTVIQTIKFNIGGFYKQIKIIAATDPYSWAAIVNKAWDNLDATCLGFTAAQWKAMTFVQRGQAMADATCRGGVCNAVIAKDTAIMSPVNGRDVVIGWTEVLAVYEVAVYMDDMLKGTVRRGVGYFVIKGAADGKRHDYAVVSKCSNGVIGNALNGDFTYLGCPPLSAPTVSASNIPAAACPYDLTALVGALPAGIEAEWHSANNTDIATIVTDPTKVADGSYYVFAKNTDNCYSATSSKVTVVCMVAVNCTEPQNLAVTTITGGNRVQFSPAAYPPPSNSYTVKRRLASAPEVDGSYTTIGTPTFNSSANRWEILDATAVNNTLYMYKAISNCTSNAPAAYLQYANITCPALSVTPANNSAAYSFVPVGGEVTKYEVEIFNDDTGGTTRVYLGTHVPVFPNPITGAAPYLASGTNYLIRVKVYIGSYVKICPYSSFVTIADNYRLIASYNHSITSVTGLNVPVLGSTGVNGTLGGIHGAMSGSYTVTVGGTGTPSTYLAAWVSGSVVYTIDITGPGPYTMIIAASPAAQVKIEILIHDD